MGFQICVPTRGVEALATDLIGGVRDEPEQRRHHDLRSDQLSTSLIRAAQADARLTSASRGQICPWGASLATASISSRFRAPDVSIFLGLELLSAAGLFGMNGCSSPGPRTANKALKPIQMAGLFGAAF
jgi:hypothetical protein